MPSVATRSAANATSAPDTNAAADKNERWAARFGSVIARHGVATIPQALFYYQGTLDLSAQEVWFVCCLLADKWDGELPRTSLTLLAKGSSVSLCQIRRIRGSLEQKGYLRVVQSFNEQQAQAANCYDLAGLLRELELLIAREPASANEIQAADTPPYLRSLSGDWSFLERYGRILIQRGIATIPQALFSCQAQLRLTPQQVWFCCYVLTHKWDTEYPYPSLSKMAERTGYSRRQLQFIQESLVAQGYLRLVPRSNPDGGQDSNGFDFSGLLTALGELLQPDNGLPSTGERPTTVAPGAARTARQRQRRGTVVCSSGQQLMSAAGGALDSPEGDACSSQGGSACSSQGGGACSSQEGSASDSQEGGASTSQRGVRLIRKGGAPDSQTRGAPDSQTRGAPDSHEEESDQEESDQEESDQEENDSNQRATPKKAGDDQTALRYSPYIAGIIMDYSRELGDLANSAAKTTQALRLWQSSALPEDRFVALLHQAKSITREYQGKQGLGTITNRMAYFFRVSRDLIARSSSPGAANEVTR